MEAQESAPAPDAPPAEAPAEALPAEGEVVETPPAGEPAPEGTPAPAAEEAPDPFSDFGGRESVEAAHRMYEATRTEDGVIALFLEAAGSLGIGLDKVQALFETGEPAEPEEPPDPDEPITRADFEKYLADQRAASERQQQEATQAEAAATVRSTIESLGLEQGDPAIQVVLNFADNHVGQDFSKENVAAAVRAGYADYQAAVEKEARTYLAKKKEQGDSVPSAPAGSGAPSEPPPPEPQNVAEAIKQARKRLSAA